MTETLKLAVKWIPPECLTTKKFSEKSDIWAMGVTMWEIMSYGAVPYAGTRVPEIPGLVQGGLRLGQPPRCGDDLYAVMQKCWHSEPQKRWSFEELVHLLKASFDDASLHFPPPRDIGSLLNAKLSDDVRKLSISVHKAKSQASIRRSKSGGVATLAATPVVEEAEADESESESGGASVAATASRKTSSDTAFAGSFANTTESRMRVTSISAVRRRGGTQTPADNVVLATEVGAALQQPPSLLRASRA